MRGAPFHKVAGFICVLSTVLQVSDLIPNGPELRFPQKYLWILCRTTLDPTDCFRGTCRSRGRCVPTLSLLFLLPQIRHSVLRRHCTETSAIQLCSRPSCPTCLQHPSVPAILGCAHELRDRHSPHFHLRPGRPFRSSDLPNISSSGILRIFTFAVLQPQIPQCLPSPLHAIPLAVFT